MTKPRTRLTISLLAIVATSTIAWLMFDSGDPDPAAVSTTTLLPSQGAANDDSTVIPTPTTAAAGAPLVMPYPTGAGIEFPIDGSPLPSGISNTYQDAGGTLLREPPAKDYGIGAWPVLAGVGVYTTDVEVTITRDGPSAVVREDSTVWLFSDPRPLAKLIGDLAVALGLPGSTTTETRPSPMGPCTMATFASSDGTEWTIGGCEFTDTPGVRSLGVGRKARYDESAAATPAQAAAVDVSSVVPALAAAVTGWSTSFGQPDDVHGATTVRRVTLSSDMAVLAAADVLEQALADGGVEWRRVDSIDDVTTLSSPFATWSIAPEGITYTVWGDPT